MISQVSAWKLGELNLVATYGHSPERVSNSIHWDWPTTAHTPQWLQCKINAVIFYKWGLNHPITNNYKNI